MNRMHTQMPDDDDEDDDDRTKKYTKYIQILDIYLTKNKAAFYPTTFIHCILHIYHESMSTEMSFECI